MKHLLLAVFFWGCWAGAEGQKSDYVWLSGYDSHFRFDTSLGHYFGTSVLDFNYTPRQVRYDSLAMNFDLTNTSFCDSDGNLLFYTNGIYIANALDEKIQNSDSLNEGYFQYEWDPLIEKYGYRSPQGIICIPKVGANNEQYYLLHSWVDSFNNVLVNKRLLLTSLDMALNAGHGTVLFKNHPLIIDTLGYALSAVKHGNGKDWWLLISKKQSNCFFRVLIDSSGVHVMPTMTCGGPNLPLDDVEASCFSPDGSKFVHIAYDSGLTIFDFDRCTGELTNPLYLPLPILAQEGWIGIGVAVSPNNRFLYLTLTNLVYQFDLSATDILGSIDTVGIYDNTYMPFATLFGTIQNGPDGKIYIGCNNADTVYHVIERPDEKGDSCLLRQHSLSLPSASWGVPSFPNYRLGALPSSACDTISGLSETARAEKEKILKVFPNPATDYVVVDYGFTDWSKGDAQLEITNQLGQVVHKQPLPKYSGFQKIDVSSFASGLYMVGIKRGSALVATAKFAKE